MRKWSSKYRASVKVQALITAVTSKVSPSSYMCNNKNRWWKMHVYLFFKIHYSNHRKWQQWRCCNITLFIPLASLNHIWQNFFANYPQNAPQYRLCSLSRLFQCFSSFPMRKLFSASSSDLFFPQAKLFTVDAEMSAFLHSLQSSCIWRLLPLVFLHFSNNYSQSVLITLIPLRIIKPFVFTTSLLVKSCNLAPSCPKFKKPWCE